VQKGFPGHGNRTAQHMLAQGGGRVLMVFVEKDSQHAPISKNVLPPSQMLSIEKLVIELGKVLEVEADRLVVSITQRLYALVIHREKLVVLPSDHRANLETTSQLQQRLHKKG